MAIHNDDELARRRRDTDARAGRTRPRRQGVDAHTWTPERAALTDVADLLLRVIGLLHTQVSGKRQRPPKPMPRPVYAADRIEQNDTIRRHRERVAMLLPKQGGG